MDMDELNEVATLLHITSEIATNHPSLAGISRVCQRRLAEINQEFLDSEKAPTPTPRTELRAAQHTTGKLSLKQNEELPNNGSTPTVERRV